MITKLPGAQELYVRYLHPWFDGGARPGSPRLETYVIKGLAARKKASKQRLRADYAGLLKDYLEQTLPVAAQEIYQPILSFTSFDVNVITAIQAHYTIDDIIALVACSDPLDFTNSYLTAVSHFAAALSTLYLKHERFSWLFDHPYFHSVIVHETTGTAIPIFDWALWALSANGVNENIVDKCQAVMQNLCNKNL